MRYLEILKNSKLFEGINQSDISEMIVCLNTFIKEYKKDETILWEGDNVDNIGIVLCGHGRSVKTDLSGKTTIITLLDKGSYIGILLSCSKYRKSPVSVQALDNMSVLYIPIDNIFTRCNKLCKRHDILVLNIFNGIAEKAMVLHDRNDCLIKPSVREKIITYLARISKEKNSPNFKISLNRNAMAEYLNIDRSALSRELSKMQKDGLINYNKNTFELRN